MSDLVLWKVHGPVKTLRSEFAEWDPDRQDWQPTGHFNVVSFREDGTLLTHDVHNPDGSIAHSRSLYDDAGRLAERRSWMDDGPVNRTVYKYDEAGRLTRTTKLNQDGSRTDVEICSYDANGRKTKVRMMASREAPSDGLGASTGYYAIEGADSLYGAPGAATMTTAYDEKDLPVRVSFHDANHLLINEVTLMRDETGKLMSEEWRQGERSMLQAHLDKASPEERERLAAALEAVFGGTLSKTIYRYDAKGRRISRDKTMGTLGGDSTTYRYEDRDDPVEETTEHKTREGDLDETGNMQYGPEQMNVHHTRFEYLYDLHGNWTERIVSSRSESELDYQRSNIERRIITYYSS